jgi:hypothetical protein
MYFFSRDNFFRLGAYLITGAVFFISCNDPEIVGLDVQPPGDKINFTYTDTTTVKTLTVREDSLRTDEVSRYLLGSYTDSVFGRTDAGIYAQVLLPSLNVNLGSSLSLDSAVLTLAYSGYYGDTTTPQMFRIYQMTEDMHLDSGYYSNRAFSYNPVELGSITVAPSPGDSVLVNGVNTAPHLRIPLNPISGAALLQMSSDSQLTTNENFLSLFKGLYIKADPVNSGGGIFYFNLLDPQSKLTLYYQNSVADSQSFSFVFTTASARMTHFDHEYLSPLTPVGQQLADSTHGDSLVYLQSMAGVKTKIRFPNLKNLIAGGMIAVNKAELEITVADNSDNRLAVPGQILVLGIDVNGTPVFLPDQFEPSAYYGGVYNATTRKYKFNIARYVQSVLTGRLQDYGLYLAVSGGVVQASRAIFCGATNPTYRMKLNLYYTKPN